MNPRNSPRFDPPDMAQVKLLKNLTPSQRIQLMLDARELVVGLMRGRLSKKYPELSPTQINLKILESLEYDSPAMPKQI